MRSRDGTIVEVSEWKSREAIDAAHKNRTFWQCGKFFAVCDCVPLNTIPRQPICSPASRPSKIDAFGAHISGGISPVISVLAPQRPILERAGRAAFL